MLRGDVVRLIPRARAGHEQQPPRIGVIVQSDVLSPLSTVPVAPTSQSAMATYYRPAMTIGSATTRVLVEQLAAVDVRRVSDPVGRVGVEDMWAVDEALSRVVGLH